MAELGLNDPIRLSFLGQLNQRRPVWQPEYHEVLVRAILVLGAVKMEGSEDAYCAYDYELLPAADQIIKYDYNAHGHLSHFLFATLSTALLVLTLSVLALNVYFRGFVYVICGPRKRVQQA